MPAQSNILLVDEDERLRTAASKVLAGKRYRVSSAVSGRQAVDLLKSQKVALVISDLRMADLDGLALLKVAREIQPEVEVVMITGHGNVEKAVEAMKLGAYDFLEKPLDSAALLKTVAKALEKQRFAGDNRRLCRQLPHRRGVESLIGESPAIKEIKKLIHQIAPTNVNVLILGETGTGTHAASLAAGTLPWWQIDSGLRSRLGLVRFRNQFANNGF